MVLRELRWDFGIGLRLVLHDAYKSDSLTWKHTQMLIDMHGETTGLKDGAGQQNFYWFSVRS